MPSDFHTFPTSLLLGTCLLSFLRSFIKYTDHVSVWEGRRNLWFLGELPHHLLPWQLNSKGRKSRNEERQTDKGGEENWMRNAYWEGEERMKGNGGNKRCTLTAKSHHSGSVCSAGWRIWNLIFVIEGCCCSTVMSTHTNHRVLLVLCLLSWNCRYLFLDTETLNL